MHRTQKGLCQSSACQSAKTANVFSFHAETKKIVSVLVLLEKMLRVAHA